MCLNLSHSVLIDDLYLAYFTAINAQIQLEKLAENATMERTAAFLIFTYASQKYNDLLAQNKTKVANKTSSDPTNFNIIDLAYLNAVKLHEYSLALMQNESVDESKKMIAIVKDEEATLKYLDLIKSNEKLITGRKGVIPVDTSTATGQQKSDSFVDAMDFKPLARKINIPAFLLTATSIPTTTLTTTTLPETTNPPTTTTTTPTRTTLPQTTNPPTTTTTTPHPEDGEVYEDKNIQGENVDDA